MKWWQSDIVAIDVEATGTDWKSDRIFGVAVAWLDEGGQIAGFYKDTRQDPDFLVELRDRAPHLKTVVNHFIKYDTHMLLNEDVRLPLDRSHCTMMRMALLDEHRHSYSLDSCAKDLLGKTKSDADLYRRLAEMFGGKAIRSAQMKNLYRAPPEMVFNYARDDAILALELFLKQEELMVGLEEVYNLERRLYPHIFDMERRGIRVDPDEAEVRMGMITGEVTRLQKELDDLAGFPVNPNPSGSIHQLFEPKQIGEKSYRCKDGTIVGVTEGGKPSLDAEALRLMRHPAAKIILELRKLIKTRDTFIAGHILGHMGADHYVHPNINQTKGDDGGTGTGRLSYTSPALQQIPSRDKRVASIVRPIFLPDRDEGWSYGDLDQHELRIFHHYVNDPTIVRAYRDNPDLDGHGAVADLTGLPRNPPEAGGANAKQMNLGMVFNMGGGSLAQEMGLPVEEAEFQDKRGRVVRYIKPGPEAQAIIDRYYEMMPGVKKIAKQATSLAKSRGYVKTIKGRRIRFPRGEFTHKASGLVYQGTAGDLNKENICRICEYLNSVGRGRLLLNIHDEYSVSLPFGCEEDLRQLKAEIQRRPEIRVPLRIDFSALASNWWDATNADSVTK